LRLDHLDVSTAASRRTSPRRGCSLGTGVTGGSSEAVTLTETVPCEPTLNVYLNVSFVM